MQADADALVRREEGGKKCAEMAKEKQRYPDLAGGHRAARAGLDGRGFDELTGIGALPCRALALSRE